jgi:hypothetical protein
MLIECQTCRMRELACGECVVTTLLGPPTVIPVDLDEQGRRALAVLADAGLIAPMRSIARSERAS